MELERLHQNHYATIVDVIGDFISKKEELSPFPFNCQSLRWHFNDLNDQVTQRANMLIVSMPKPTLQHILVLFETCLENEQEQSIPNFNCIVKYKPQNVRGGGIAIYHNTNDTTNVVTPRMEVNIREVTSLSVNVSPVGELCAAECRSENGQTILIVVIYIRVIQTNTDIIDFLEKKLLAYEPLLVQRLYEKIMTRCQ